MIKQETSIPGLYLMKADRFADERGFFSVPYQREEFKALVPDVDFSVAQISHSRSVQRVIRGIHAEPWNKLIYIAKGAVFSAIVDLRENATFGRVEGIELQEGDLLFAPDGVGNSFQVLSEDVEYTYFVDGLWRPGLTYPAIAFDDPDLAIEWPLADPILSEKDRANPRLTEVFPGRPLAA